MRWWMAQVAAVLEWLLVREASLEWPRVSFYFGFELWQLEAISLSSSGRPGTCRLTQRSPEGD